MYGGKAEPLDGFGQLPAELVARSEVHLVGCGVLVLAIVTVLALPT